MPWKCTQHTITITAHSFLDHIFTDPGDPAVQLLQMPFSMQTSLDMLPPPHIQGGFYWSSPSKE